MTRLFLLAKRRTSFCCNKNLPSNSAAVLQCAMVYIYELREAEKGFQLIRAGIDDPQASDRDVLFMAAANLLPYAKSFPPVYRAILETFKNTTSVSFDSFLTYLIYSQSNPWEQINRNLDFIDCYKRTWYTFWIGKKFNDDFHLLLSNKTLFHQMTYTCIWKNMIIKRLLFIN